MDFIEIEDTITSLLKEIEEIDIEFSTKNNPVLTKEIIEILLDNQQIEIQSFERLSLSGWNILLHYPEKIALSSHILFILIQELIITENEELIPILIKFSKRFPKHSICFNIYLNLLIEASSISLNLMISILSIIRPKIFYNIENQSIDFKLSLIFLKTLENINNNQITYSFLNSFENHFQNCQLTLEEIEKLNFILINNFNNNNILFIELFPIIGIGLNLFELYSQTLIYLLLNFNVKCTTIQSFLNNINEILLNLKQYCLSNDNNKLNNSLIILNLLNKLYLLILIKNKNKNFIDLNELKNNIKIISNFLQFQWLGKDKLDYFHYIERFNNSSKYFNKLIDLI